MNQQKENAFKGDLTSHQNSSRFIANTEQQSDTNHQEKTIITAVVESAFEPEDIPEASRKDVISRFTQITTTSHYSGPLPPAEHLMAYNNIIPDGAERIMRIAEKDQEHRIKTDSRLVNGNMMTTRLGQIFGLAIGITIVLLGFICIMNGHELAGSFMSGSSVAGLVSVFVIGRNKKAESS